MSAIGDYIHLSGQGYLKGTTPDGFSKIKESDARSVFNQKNSQINVIARGLGEMQKAKEFTNRLNAFHNTLVSGINSTSNKALDDKEMIDSIKEDILNDIKSLKNSDPALVNFGRINFDNTYKDIYRQVLEETGDEYSNIKRLNEISEESYYTHISTVDNLINKIKGLLENVLNKSGEVLNENYLYKMILESEKLFDNLKSANANVIRYKLQSNVNKNGSVYKKFKDNAAKNNLTIDQQMSKNKNDMNNIITNTNKILNALGYNYSTQVRELSENFIKYALNYTLPDFLNNSNGNLVATLPKAGMRGINSAHFYSGFEPKTTNGNQVSTYGHKRILDDNTEIYINSHNTPEKVDVTLGMEFGFSVKDYNLSVEMVEVKGKLQNTYIHLVDKANFLGAVQNEDAGFVNHFFNAVVGKYHLPIPEHKNAEQHINYSTYRDAVKTMTKLLFLKALTGYNVETVNKETNSIETAQTANYIILIDNSKTDNNIYVLSMGAVFEAIISSNQNFFAEDGLVRYSNRARGSGDVYEWFGPYNIVDFESPQARINDILFKAHAITFSAGMPIKDVNKIIKKTF